MTCENFYGEYISYTYSPTTFGGIIYLSDFESDYEPRTNKDKSSIIASRIMNDWRFDQQCKKNLEQVNRTKNFNK